VLALGLAERVVDVRGKSVLDVGCGSGVAACAAARLGAARVVANDVDPLAVRAASILAARHGVVVEPRVADVLAAPVVDADVILCADLIYSEAQRAPFARALARWKAEGREVLVADSGRPFFDPNGLVARRHIDVEVPRGVEGKTTRRATLYSF
jgi:predicted nicotinamide N-methyase